MTPTDYFNLSILASTIREDIQLINILLNGHNLVLPFPYWNTCDNIFPNPMVETLEGREEEL